MERGKCTTCGIEYVLLIGIVDDQKFQDASEVCSCPYCGSKSRKTYEEFGLDDYELPENIFENLSEYYYMPFSHCANCSENLLLQGKTNVVRIELKVSLSGISLTECRHIPFCTCCLENSSQNELIRGCHEFILQEGPQASISGEGIDYTELIIAEAWKKRVITT